jgi:hypothetical protein
MRRFEEKGLTSGNTEETSPFQRDFGDVGCGAAVEGGSDETRG